MGHGTEPSFKMSDSATMHMETQPEPLSATGTPNVVSAPIRSLFQTDTLAIRAKLTVAWTRRSGGVSYLDDPGW